LSKGGLDCLADRGSEVEFVSFDKSLPQMLDATSTSKSTMFLTDRKVTISHR